MQARTSGIVSPAVSSRQTHTQETRPQPLIGHKRPDLDAQVLPSDPKRRKAVTGATPVGHEFIGMNSYDSMMVNI